MRFPRRNGIRMREPDVPVSGRGSPRSGRTNRPDEGKGELQAVTSCVGFCKRRLRKVIPPLLDGARRLGAHCEGVKRWTKVPEGTSVSLG